MIVFWLSVGKEWDAKFVQIQGKRLPFYIFSYERTLLENCIRHSSKCTNGYFLSYYIDLSVRDAAGETHLSLNQHNLLGQASFTACCDQCTFHSFDPKLHFSFCWMDKNTSKFTWYFSSYIPELESPDFGLSQRLGNRLYKQNCTIASGGKDGGLLFFFFSFLPPILFPSHFVTS